MASANGRRLPLRSDTDLSFHAVCPTRWSWFLDCHSNSLVNCTYGGPMWWLCRNAMEACAAMWSCHSSKPCVPCVFQGLTSCSALGVASSPLDSGDHPCYSTSTWNCGRSRFRSSQLVALLLGPFTSLLEPASPLDLPLHFSEAPAPPATAKHPYRKP